jgi:hypothetical protein
MDNKNNEIKIFLSNKKNSINNSKLFEIINKLVYDEIKIRILENSDLRLFLDVKRATQKINNAIFNSVADFKFGMTGKLGKGIFIDDFVEKDIFVNEKELNENSETIEFTIDFWALFIDILGNSKTNEELINKIR